MKAQGRPKKVRIITKLPKVHYFSPRGRPGRPEEIELSIDEFEAIKLADYQNLNQSQGAVAMGISRPSFGRILRSSRKKFADDAARQGSHQITKIRGVGLGGDLRELLREKAHQLERRPARNCPLTSFPSQDFEVEMG